MKKDDPDYIVRVEQAIADKYGEETIQNPKAEWDENKEKVYLEQMRDLYKKQKKNDEANDKVELNGIKVSRKLLNRESKTGCPVCGAFSHSTRDDVSLVMHVIVHNQRVFIKKSLVKNHTRITIIYFKC